MFIRSFIKNRDAIFRRSISYKVISWSIIIFIISLTSISFVCSEASAQAPPPIFGFADLHNHQFANLGFGGGMLHGWPYGDMESSLPWCTDKHGPGGLLDPFTIFTNGGGHLVGGWPQFDGWPRWNSITHQQVYYEWLRRAFDGGLKLMVMPAVSNKTLCEMFYFPEPGFTCNDMDAVDLQIYFAYDLQNYIDSVSGGPGMGWYRIVTSAAEARQVINSGKMAIVLGIEVDTLFNCGVYSGCTSNYVAGELDRYYQKGVRHIFPVHLFNNGFGSVALYEDLFNVMNKRETGDFFVVRPCLTPDAFRFSGEIGLASFLSLIAGGALYPPEYDMLASDGHCNALPLKPLGESLINMMMDRRMIIDIDHMSLFASGKTLDIAEWREYPVVSGHTGMLGISLGHKKSEAQKSDEMLERIKNVGGLVATILHQGSREEIAQAPGSPVAHDCGKSSRSWVQAYLYAAQKMGGAVAIGSDFNGGVKQPAPRFGLEACDGDLSQPQDPGSRVLYPFVTETGVFMYQSQMGGRPYIDIFNPEVHPQVFDINEDGLAHVGMLPDFIADLKELGLTTQDLAPLFGSAEAYVHLWEKIDAANLRVESLSNPPASLEVGWSFNILDITSNFGASATGASSITRFYLSSDDIFTSGDIFIAERTVPPLNSWHGSDAVTAAIVPAQTPIGNYYLIACADAAGTIFESNEKDNCTASQNTIQITPYVARQCFEDNDGDGYQKLAADWNDPPCPSMLSIDIDCNDNNASIHRGVTELYCDGLDNDCNGIVDDVLYPTPYYRDLDGDGYGNPAVTSNSCLQLDGYVSDNTDCNDAPKSGGYSVNPGAPEICGNAVDDDCDGAIDETGVYYMDADGDGYGNPGISTTACSQPTGYVTNNTDCDDSRASIHPFVPEICDGFDNNCDWQTDEGFDMDWDGWTICGLDCNESDPAINPGAVEVCDGIDNNCNGSVDEGLLTTYYRDIDGDGYGNPNSPVQACSQPAGYVTNNADCNDDNRFVNPGAAEVCNGVDDNCNGPVDEGVQNTYYKDSDADGYGNPDGPKNACSLPAGYASDNTDCNDQYASIHPGATEVCGNDLDDNCNGIIDETRIYYLDEDEDGYGNPDKTIESCEQPIGYVADNTDCNDSDRWINPGAAEVCNGVDDNCNGTIDEGFDEDGDGVADCFDNCPKTANKEQLDTDADGVGDACDNCRLVANKDQLDGNSAEDDNKALDGIQHYGNLCDPDFDESGFVNIIDFNEWRKWAGKTVAQGAPADIDLDGNGTVWIQDFNIWRKYYGKVPGPGVGD
ncbi:MAG: membrane dipeptidase [Nitrospirae bacterium]|nr:membrane dipeptidase [Nitrospirota bacterium]